MQVIVKEVSGLPLVRRACEMTMHGQQSKVSLRSLYRAEHSPIRCRLFWIELLGVETFVSVHLVRHKHGVDHYVQSNRDDIWLQAERVECPACSGTGMVLHHPDGVPFSQSLAALDECPECEGDGFILQLPTIDRTTHLNHGMLINAQALINISRKRLCIKSHRRTVAAWTQVRKALRDLDPDLFDFMVPECSYRGCFCPELKPCAVGPKKMARAYPRWSD